MTMSILSTVRMRTQPCHHTQPGRTLEGKRGQERRPQTLKPKKPKCKSAACMRSSPKTISWFDEPTPNEFTKPPPGASDAIREPVRPQRSAQARQPPDVLTYASGAFAAILDDSHLLTTTLAHAPDAAFVVDIESGADRLVAHARELHEYREEPFMVADEEWLSPPPRWHVQHCGPRPSCSRPNFLAG